MTEIAQLFESALRQNQAKAAMGTVARMPAETTLAELLRSDAGEAMRALTLRDLAQALAEGGFGDGGRVPRAALNSGSRSPSARVAARAPAKPGARRTVVSAEPDPVWPESREERIYRRILDAIEGEPLTIGQIAKRLEIEVDELRGYLTWMKKMGKVVSKGRARATRYHVVE